MFLCLAIHSACATLQPIRVETLPGHVEFALMHVIESDTSCHADMRLAALFDRSPIHTFLFDSEGVLLTANKAALFAFQRDNPGSPQGRLPPAIFACPLTLLSADAACHVSSHQDPCVRIAVGQIKLFFSFLCIALVLFTLQLTLCSSPSNQLQCQYNGLQPSGCVTVHLTELQSDVAACPHFMTIMVHACML